MMPLCTTRKVLFGSERCGCELTSDGGPCVAQRVCAMPTWFTSTSCMLSVLSSAQACVIRATAFRDEPTPCGEGPRDDHARFGADSTQTRARPRDDPVWSGSSAAMHGLGRKAHNVLWMASLSACTLPDFLITRMSRPVVSPSTARPTHTGPQRQSVRV